MPEISEAQVEERLRAAAALNMRLLEPMRPSHDVLDGELNMTIGTQCPNEFLSWLDWLDADDAALVQARIHGARWKLISWRFGISRATAHRRWRRSLRLIARRLQEDRL